MRQLFVFTLAMLTLCFAACTAQSPQNSNSASAAQPSGNMTPTETFRAYSEAAQKKDVTAIEKLLSRGTLEFVNKAAQEQKISTDEVLSAIVDEVGESEIETRNEQINGDTAEIEYKNNVTSGWDKLPLVREDGRWKIALDKVVEQAEKQIKEMEEEMNDRELSTQQKEKPASANSNSSQSNTQSNKQ